MALLREADPLAWLDDHLDAASREGGVPPSLWRASLYGPLRDFLSRPSKRLRAALVTASFALAGGVGAPPDALCDVIELLHAGSLIIDDIEDGAETRRGGPALHARYGVPTALNAGNWLYFCAMSRLDELPLPADALLDLHRRVTATMVRCHGGQALDLSARVGRLAQHDVVAVVRQTTTLKTGALMSLAAYAGARAAGGDAGRVARLAAFGVELGVALQMLDDLGSVRAPSRADKGLEDLRGGRPTWPWAWLAESLEPRAFAELQRASRDVEQHGAPAEPLLVELRARIGDGSNSVVHATLARAQRDLARDIGPSEALRHLSRDISRLEQSYG